MYHQDINKKVRVNSSSDLNCISWYSRVQDQCDVCEKIYWGEANIKHHVKKIHGSSHKNYRLLSEDDKYSCKICSSNIKKDYNNIKQHLHCVHQLKISEYSVVHEPEENIKTSMKYRSKDLNKLKRKQLYDTYKLKSLRVNVKNIHMSSEQATQDDFQIIPPWYCRLQYQYL